SGSAFKSACSSRSAPSSCQLVSSSVASTPITTIQRVPNMRNSPTPNSLAIRNKLPTMKATTSSGITRAMGRSPYSPLPAEPRQPPDENPAFLVGHGHGRHLRRIERHRVRQRDLLPHRRPVVSGHFDDAGAG